MADGRKGPIGIELVRRQIVSERDINKALEYQRENPGKKIGDILHLLGLCDAYKLLEAIGEILEEKTIFLTQELVNIDPAEYVSLDAIKQNKSIPFDVSGGKVKVCFADNSNKRNMETVRLLLLNKGLVMEKYITFESNIDQIVTNMQNQSTEKISAGKDVTEFLDSVIKTGMVKRASDIHVEPMEKQVRIRYRIDGELITVANVEKEKQAQIIGRLKAISNMHQEKQESQDGRIISYPEYNIRVSSQRNIFGEKFVLRLLKKNSNIRKIFDLGYPKEDNLLKTAFDKRNSIVIVAAPTGEGKTTTLYSIIDYLNKSEINITTIEDPVEIRIPGLNQVEIDGKVGFSNSLRTVLRQDPDIILVGEIRDKETAEISMQAGQTGHYVLSTIHTIDSVETITRLRKLGISDYDISTTVATSLSQRLVRKLCKKCAKEREFTKEEKEIIENTEKKYNVKLSTAGLKTYDSMGCEECNHTGYFDRIAVFETLIFSDRIKELISKGASSIEIKKEALQEGFEPMQVDAIRKVLAGITDIKEASKKLVIN